MDARDIFDRSAPHLLIEATLWRQRLNVVTFE